MSEGRYGNSALIQSSQRTDRQYTKVSDLNPSLADTVVLLRGRIHGSRQKGTPPTTHDELVGSLARSQSCHVAGNLVFITLRQRAATVQIVASKGPTTSPQMIKFLAAYVVVVVVLLVSRSTNTREYSLRHSCDVAFRPSRSSTSRARS